MYGHNTVKIDDFTAEQLTKRLFLLYNWNMYNYIRMAEINIRKGECK